MVVTDRELKTLVTSYYSEHHSEFMLTNRIMSGLVDVIRDGLENADENISFKQAVPSISSFLEKDNILEFVKDRQPNVNPVTEDVYKSLKNYMDSNSSMDNYRIIYIYRKSNHPDDNYLYSVIGYSTSTDSYCCWSTWNMSTESLNHGHYNLSTLEAAVDILKEQFNDITDEPEKYGLESNRYSNVNNVIEDMAEADWKREERRLDEEHARQNEKLEQPENVIEFNHFHRRGR